MDAVLGDLGVADPTADADSDGDVPMGDVAPRAVQKQEKKKKDKKEKKRKHEDGADAEVNRGGEDKKKKKKDKSGKKHD